MAKTERVERIESALANLSTEIVSALNGLQEDMASKVKSIGELRKGLAKDQEEMIGISNAIETFVEDMSGVLENADKITEQVGMIVEDLMDIPDNLLFEEEEDEEEYEDEKDEVSLS